MMLADKEMKLRLQELQAKGNDAWNASVRADEMKNKVFNVAIIPELQYHPHKSLPVHVARNRNFYSGHFVRFAVEATARQESDIETRMREFRNRDRMSNSLGPLEIKSSDLCKEPTKKEMDIEERAQRLKLLYFCKDIREQLQRQLKIGARGTKSKEDDKDATLMDKFVRGAGTIVFFRPCVIDAFRKQSRTSSLSTRKRLNELMKLAVRPYERIKNWEQLVVKRTSHEHYNVAHQHWKKIETPLEKNDCEYEERWKRLDQLEKTKLAALALVKKDDPQGESSTPGSSSSSTSTSSIWKQPSTSTPMILGDDRDGKPQGRGGQDGRRKDGQGKDNGSFTRSPGGMKLPPNYLCIKCKVPGHHVKECKKKSRFDHDTRDSDLVAEGGGPKVHRVKNRSKPVAVVGRSRWEFDVATEEDAINNDLVKYYFTRDPSEILILKSDVHILRGAHAAVAELKAAAAAAPTRDVKLGAKALAPVWEAEIPVGRRVSKRERTDGWTL